MRRSNLKFCEQKYENGRSEKSCSVQLGQELNSVDKDEIDKIKSKYDQACKDESKYKTSYSPKSKFETLFRQKSKLLDAFSPKSKYETLYSLKSKSQQRTYHSRENSEFSSGTFFGFSLQVCIRLGV